MAYELSKTLEYKAINVQTPLGIKNTTTIADNVVLCSILRAGLAMHTGFINFFDDAENGFVSAYRNHPNNDDYFEILVEYQAAPSFEGKNLILIDPMLATGQSVVAVFNKLINVIYTFCFEGGTNWCIYVATAAALYQPCQQCRLMVQAKLL